MRVVVDASVALAVGLNRREGSAFQQLLEDADEVLAPELLVPEVINTMWKFHQFEALPLDACERAIEFALGLVDTFASSLELHREAFLLARTTRHPAYDMFYLALARREDAIFLTVDKALGKEAERQGIRVG